MQKLKVKNRARAARGFVVNGRVTMIEPGVDTEIELDDSTADILKVSSEAGGDVEVLSSTIARATLKKGP